MGSAPPYKYILSLPERVLRSLGAISGGLLREIGNVALPAGVRRTTLYRTMVDVALRFLIQEVGQVEGIYPSEGRLAENFLLQRTASHGIELLGLRQSLTLAQFKPALAMNPDILARHAANRLRVVRQVRYSSQNENCIDLVLFLNGVPVATAEL